MTTLIIKGINELAKTIKAILVEKQHNAQWELLECYHLVGYEIIEYARQTKSSEREVCNAVSHRLGRGIRTFQYAVEFVKKYPDLEALPEGKIISWHKVVNQYLPKPKDDKGESCKHENTKEIIICLDCHLKL